MKSVEQIILSARSYPPERASHRHDHSQALFPDRGELFLEWEGLEGAVRGRDLALVPPGVTHAFWAEGPSRCIVVDIPASLYDELRPVAAPRPFRPMDARLGAVAAALKLELAGGGPADRLVAESLGLYAASALLRGEPTREPAAPVSARRIARLAEEYLRTHASEAISVSDVATAAGTSSSHLQRCFRAEMGCSVVAFAQRLRLDAAKALLAETDLTVLEIASRVGFASQSHLSRLFSREVGCAPREYRAGAAMTRSRIGPR